MGLLWGKSKQSAATKVPSESITKSRRFSLRKTGSFRRFVTRRASLSYTEMNPIHTGKNIKKKKTDPDRSKPAYSIDFEGSPYDEPPVKKISESESPVNYISDISQRQSTLQLVPVNRSDDYSFRSKPKVLYNFDEITMMAIDSDDDYLCEFNYVSLYSSTKTLSKQNQNYSRSFALHSEEDNFGIL